MRRVPSVGGALTVVDLISRAESREWVQRISERQLRSRLEQIHDTTRYVAKGASAKHSIAFQGPAGGLTSGIRGVDLDVER